MSSLTPRKYTSHILMLLSIIIALAILSLRSTQSVGTDLFHPSLWAEDGNIFLNQATQLGASSIVTPYAGYLHLIPRVIALVSNFIPLSHVPILFHLAWLTSLLAFVYLVSSRLNKSGVNPIILLWTTALIIAQPQAGEIFFTLTNIQWFTGMGLLVFLSFPWENKLKLSHLAILVLVSLSGPFSILAIPILAIRYVFFKDLVKYRAIYATIILCAATQILFQLNSPKVFLSGAPNLDPNIWVSALVRFFSFGNEYPLATLFSFAFWACVPWIPIIAVIAGKKLKQTDGDSVHAFALLLFISGFELLAVGYLRDNIEIISPIISKSGAAAGSRYYLIPYTLILIGSIISTRRNPFRAVAILGAFSVVSYANFVTPERRDYQWDAYVKLANSVPNMQIPIAPRIGANPGWFVSTTDRHVENNRNSSHLVPLESTNPANGNIYQKDQNQVIDSNSADFYLYVKPNTYCEASDSIGIKIEGSRESSGWIHMLWASNGKFNDKDSLLDFQPSGNFTSYFAFKKTGAEDVIQLRPSFTNSKTEISEIRIFCLK